ncbi:phosphonate ABC transporter substrate-binding protein [Bacteroidia bacterium]|nr:phosphonate ABC transporter substrate-binding protein [Bacteroidia bacterium]
MKIVVTGTRGIPDILGGVETHCEELYPRLAALGFDVTVVRRACYAADNRKEYKGVRLKNIFAPRSKSLEAFLHTFLAVIYAKMAKADVLHIHAVGPSLLMPLAKLLGLKTVMTHHGADYERQKWGRAAKFMLRRGERYGVRFADKVIVISESIKQSISGRKDSILIFNGVNQPVLATDSAYIEHLGLQKGKYVLAMGRFVEEKGFDLLIKAFPKNAGFKLVIAGDADHETPYSQSLKSAENVVLTGFVRGAKLNELLTHARLFALPSFHEGLPIALLEAMSYGLPILASDIPANKALCLSDNDYFRCGDADDLAQKLTEKLSQPFAPQNYDLTAYDWDKIARQTAEVYAQVLNGHPAK